VAPAPVAPQPPARAAKPAPAPTVAPAPKPIEAPSFDDENPFGTDDLGDEAAATLSGAEAIQPEAPRVAAPSVAKSPSPVAKKTATRAKLSAAGATSPVQPTTPKKEKTFPHFTHMGISLCTLFLWTPVWLLHYLIWKSLQKKAKVETAAS